MVRNGILETISEISNTSTTIQKFLVIVTEEDDQFLNATIADCCIKPFINQLPENIK
jgi:hypothetical protein